MRRITRLLIQSRLGTDHIWYERDMSLGDHVFYKIMILQRKMILSSSLSRLFEHIMRLGTPLLENENEISGN